MFDDLDERLRRQALSLKDSVVKSSVIQSDNPVKTLDEFDPEEFTGVDFENYVYLYGFFRGLIVGHASRHQPEWLDDNSD